MKRNSNSDNLSSGCLILLLPTSVLFLFLLADVALFTGAVYVFFWIGQSFGAF